MKVAFIGVGTMGGPMALNIAKRFGDMAIYDVSHTALEPFRSTNCRIASSPGDAADGADIVMTMLPDSAHVRSTMFEKNGVCSTLKREALIVDFSTISATESLAIGDELVSRDYRFMDAPIGRTPRDAAAGTLLVIVGGDAADIERAKPLFEMISDEVVHAGPRGSGIKLKLVNNYMSTVGALLTAEALNLAKKAGLDRDITVKVLSNTTAGRGQLLVNFPKKVLAGDVTPDFPLKMAHKDVSHALALGAQTGSPLFLGAIAREMFGLAAPWNRANEDWTAVLLLLEDVSRANDRIKENEERNWR
jgi:4-hydroxybutyrate dehydrogenase / sulfolactaldehyde 3-reductase